VRSHRLALSLVVLAALIVGVTLLVRGGGDSGPPPAAVIPNAGLPDSDPLAWTPSRSEEYANRAAAGMAHVLYGRTEEIGGIVSAAQRVEALRPLIERAAAAHDVDPDTLGAIVLLESAGRPDARATNDPEGAVGLAQILAETATGLLGMHVDLPEAKRIAKGMVKAGRKGDAAEVERLRAQLRRADTRLDPAKALDGAARYLQIAKGHLGRDDLAVASYHMGIGNLQTALERYGEGTVPYARLFFDSTPVRHDAAWSFLADLGDDSSTYVWRVNAAREILRLQREDPDELARIAELQTSRNSAEVLLHPPDDTEHFDDPGALSDARDGGAIAPLPAAYLARHGIRIDPQMGELAKKVDAEPSLYRGLRREALATLAYLGASVQSISKAKTPLRLTSTVRDDEYQRVLDAVNPEATHSYSLHTTGFTFDLARDYASRAQAMALQFVLDRLTELNLIAWVREPGAIHVTVASDAARLMKPMGVLPG
jgi:transglycosylase-like protein with SLT domain